jgi:DTW domain-containing protein
MLGELCICSLLPKLTLRTKLLLLIHRFEARKPTNTGQLAAACLTHSEVIVRGNEGEPSLPFVHDAETQPVYLFPHDDAVPLANFRDHHKPIVLIVPDGTWRQAWKVRKRVAGLAQVPCVSIPNGESTRYGLRSEPREGGLATIEAIARALEILEGAAVRASLEQIFDVMVDRTLGLRGVKGFAPRATTIDQEPLSLDPLGLSVRSERGASTFRRAREYAGSPGRLPASLPPAPTLLT